MRTKICILLRVIAAGILFQTLYFKFTGAAESREIFTTLGVEPWGRIMAGVAELVAGILLLVPLTQTVGAAIGLGVMIGAILSHVLVLGIAVQNDGGLLFILACAVFSACALILTLQAEQARAFAVQLAGSVGWKWKGKGE